MNKRVSKVTIYSDRPGVTLVEFDRQDGSFRLRKIKSEVRAEMINRLVNSPSMQLQECVVLKQGYLTMRFVPVAPEPIDNLPVVAAKMFETLRAWCNYWDTIEEWVGDEAHIQGNRLHSFAMQDRKEYMRLTFGDAVDNDPIYKDVPNG